MHSLNALIWASYTCLKYPGISEIQQRRENEWDISRFPQTGMLEVKVLWISSTRQCDSIGMRNRPRWWPECLCGHAEWERSEEAETPTLPSLWMLRWMPATYSGALLLHLIRSSQTEWETEMTSCARKTINTNTCRVKTQALLLFVIQRRGCRYCGHCNCCRSVTLKELFQIYLFFPQNVWILIYRVKKVSFHSENCYKISQWSYTGKHIC